MFVRLHHHLTINILANEQFGFQTNSSTEKAINRLLDQNLTALNARHSVAGIFCDLKAFDCVNHIIFAVGRLFHARPLLQLQQYCTCCWPSVLQQNWVISENMTYERICGNPHKAVRVRIRVSLRLTVR
jgi:hypothetical protein